MDSDLQFILSDSGVSLLHQVSIARHYGSLRKFSALGDDRAAIGTSCLQDFALPADSPENRSQIVAIVSAWETSKEYLAKEIELKAEAKILGQPRNLQIHERQAMLRAVEAVHGTLNDAECPAADYLSLKAEETEANEPTAAPLDEILSKLASSSSSIQSTVDGSGHIRVTRTKTKSKMPSTTEEYRRIMKVEMFSWLAMASRYKAKHWLHGLTADPFLRFVEFILGDRVFGIQILTGEGSQQKVKPDWAIVLSYEQKLRKEAMKRVLEGHTLAEAMVSVTKDADLKEAYFTTPVALKSAVGDSQAHPNKFQRFNSKGNFGGKSSQSFAKGKGKGKQKSKGMTPSDPRLKGLNLAWRTPDGRELCFAWNTGECDGSCGRIHQCRVKGCYSDHKAVEHRQKQGAWQPTGVAHPSVSTPPLPPEVHPSAEIPVVKVLYLFAGRRRHSDVAAHLREAESLGKIKLILKEFDIERSPMHDLTDVSLWNEILDTLKEGGWCVIVSPPCNTFSRARFQHILHPGPKPLRTRAWPKGFPWLSNASKAVVSEANFFVEKCLEACECAACSHGFFLLEHPEDLGTVQGEQPGSIWQWQEVLDLIPKFSATCFAIHQCQFGALTPKPTRILMNMEVTDARCFCALPKFDKLGFYKGPLPRKCGHRHKHRLIGKTGSKWNTSPSAAYPAGMCGFIAHMILNARASCGRGEENHEDSLTGATTVKTSRKRALQTPTTETPERKQRLGESPDLVQRKSCQECLVCLWVSHPLFQSRAQHQMLWITFQAGLDPGSKTDATVHSQLEMILQSNHALILQLRMWKIHLTFSLAAMLVCLFKLNGIKLAGDSLTGLDFAAPLAGALLKGGRGAHTKCGNWQILHSTFWHSVLTVAFQMSGRNLSSWSQGRLRNPLLGRMHWRLCVPSGQHCCLTLRTHWRLTMASPFSCGHFLNGWRSSTIRMLVG